ncbi:hypothetical protein ACLB2K_077297 [Fragaria x ananassa]
MALVLCSNPLALNAVSSRPSNVTAATHRMHMNPMIEPHPKCCSGVRLHMPMVARKSIVKASSDPTEGAEAPSDIKKEAVPVDKLPLESKLQERLEQKSRMKLAKKIRLRRKRLVRKRKLRKKGRWPPSKMNKLKNV